MDTRRLIFLILLCVQRLNYSIRSNAFEGGASFPSLTFAEPSHKQSLDHAPARSPEFLGVHNKGVLRNHYRRFPPTHTPTFRYDCTGFFCSDPLTLAPLGTPCSCVLPMKVEVELGVAAFWVFTLVAELAVEIAAGTYVKQSQVRIVAAVSSGKDQEGTRVLIHLIPLGEKFDKMTAFLIFERFWRKQIPINATVFGDYKVLFVKYPGLPASVPSSSRGPHQLPFAVRLPTERKKTMNPRTIAAVTSSLIFVIICAVVSYIIFNSRKLKSSSAAPGHPLKKGGTGRTFIIPCSLASHGSPSLVSTISTCPSSLKAFSLAELELATCKFSSHKVLGEGGFGCVYLGMMGDGSEVAVKLLKRQDENGDREFVSEVKMLSRLHHRNLVKLLGICIEGCARCLVYELVRNGSVESHLHGVHKERGHLDWDTRVKIALGSARALAYLHEDSNPHVIHRDFKASNILLDDDFTPRVSDFGLAKVAAEGCSSHVSTHVMGTFGYVAPEYAMTGHLLVKSDVYSYGVVLLELLSGRKPVDMSRPQGQENLVTWARSLLMSREGLEQLVDPALDGLYDFDSFARVAAIASICVQPEVSHRPFMGEVVQALKSIYIDRDEKCDDVYSHNELHLPDCDECEITAEVGCSDRPTPLSAVDGRASSYVTMEHCSGLLDETISPPYWPSVGGMNALASVSRSGPLRPKWHKHAFGRLRGSMSEHGYLSRHYKVGLWS